MPLRLILLPVRVPILNRVPLPPDPHAFTAPIHRRRADNVGGQISPVHSEIERAAVGDHRQGGGDVVAVHRAHADKLNLPPFGMVRTMKDYRKAEFTVVLSWSSEIGMFPPKGHELSAEVRWTKV